MTSTAGIRAGRAFVEIGAVDRTARILARVSRNVQKWGSKLQSIGRTALTGAIAGLTPAAFGLATFAKFDDSLRKVSARSSGTGAELEALRQQAKDLGRETSFTASQVGELQAKLAQKGFNRGEIASLTPDVLNLARAGGTGDLESDAVTAADVVASTLRQFEMDASQAGHVADVLTAAINNSSVDMQGLLDALGSAGPVANDFNASLEESVAIIGSLANKGISATEAGVALRNMYVELSNSAKGDAFAKMVKDATGLDVAFEDAAGNLRPIPIILDELDKALSGLGTRQRSGILSQLFGKRVISKASAFDKGQFSDVFKAIQKGGGGAAKTAKEMDSGIGGAMRAALSAIEATAIAIGEGLWEAIQDLFGITIQSIRGFAKWVDENKSLVASVFAVVASIGAGGVALIALGAAVKVVGVGLGLLATILSTLATPWGALVLAVGALGVALYKFTSVGDTVKGVLSDLSKEAGATFVAITQALRGGDVAEAANIAWLQLKAIWTQGTSFLMNLWDKFTTGIALGLLNAAEETTKVALDLRDQLNSILSGEGIKTQDELRNARAMKEFMSLSPEERRRRKALGARVGAGELTQEQAFGQTAQQAALDALKKRMAQRQKESQEIQNELDFARFWAAGADAIDEKAEKLADEVKKGTEGVRNVAKPGVKGLLPQTITASEKGTVEAMKRFQENRNRPLEAALAESKRQTAVLEDIKDELGNGAVVREEG